MFLTFSNAMLLIGLAGVVVPVVLHLLSRARYQSVDWGGMLFLEGLAARQQHSTKLNQWFLMLVRMAVVGLLAAALAQPVLRQWNPDADFHASALRAAERGRALGIGGALACAVVAVGLLVRALSGRRTGASAGSPLPYVLVALVAAGGSAALIVRAAAWEAEVSKLAAQQPEAAPSAAGAASQERVDAAILLDCSPSMNFDENGHTRFSMAQSAAKQVIAGLHRGDRVSLLLMGRSQSYAELEPTADLQSVADRIDAARLGQDPADVAQSLRRSQDALDRAGRSARDIYVVGDRQALSWRGVNDYFVSKVWPDVLHRSPATRVYAVPVGNTDADNVAVEDIALANPPAIVGQPAEIEVDVHNYGATARAVLPLSVSVNGENALQTTVSVLGKRVARVTVPIKRELFKAAGSQVITAEVKSAGYRDDDRLDAVVQTVAPLRVLVISGDEWGEAAGDFRGEADFLKLALAPLQAVHREGTDPFKVDVVPEDRWSQANLQDYQVVVLANVERFTPAQTRLIEQFVYGGGGLLIAPGSLSRVDNYNDELWRDGSGVLPAELQDATSADGAEATTILGYDPVTPVLQFLHDRPDLMLSSTIGRYFPVTVRPSDSEALAWYTSGSPFLIESHVGRGKVLLMTTSLDADWSTLPLSNFYLPFVQSAVRYLSAGTLPSRNLLAGESIQVTLEDSVDDRASVELPNGDSVPISVTRFGGASELHFADTREPGVYRLHYKDHTGDRSVAIAVHAPHDESDLTQLTDKRWAELENGLHMKRIEPTDRPIASVIAGGREGYDLWPWALAALLAMATIELALARHWSRDAY